MGFLAFPQMTNQTRTSGFYESSVPVFLKSQFEFRMCIHHNRTGPGNGFTDEKGQERDGYPVVLKA